MSMQIRTANALAFGLLLGLPAASCKSGTDVVPVATVGIIGATDLVVGSSRQLSAVPKDVSGNALQGRTVTWTSSAPAVAPVSPTGLMTGLTIGGPVTITAAAEGQTGSADVSVIPVPVASVSVTPTPASVIIGTTKQLTATPRDSAGNPLAGRAVSWSTSAPETATVSSSGLVTTVALGAATITASSEGRAGQATISVIPVPVASVTVNPSSATVAISQVVQLSATLRDSAGGVLTGRTIAWSSSNPAVANVTTAGQVTGISAGGPVTITATSESKTATASITVVAVRVASVSVSPADGSVTVGDSVRLTATTKDSAGNTLSGRAIVWSTSNAAIATVSSSGYVKGVAVGGPVTITALSEGVSGTASVTVRASCTPTEPIAIGQTVTGSLSTMDCLLGTGSYADRWRMSVTDSTGVEFTFSASGFTPRLSVASTDGFSSATSTTGVIRKTLKPGTHNVTLESTTMGSTGTYQIALQPWTDSCVAAAPIAVGQTVTGSLSTTSDCRISGHGSYADRWKLTLSQTTVIRIEMTGTFDTYLILTNQSGTSVLAQDDDGGSGENSLLDVSLSAGTYIIWANSYAPDVSGDYTLAVLSGQSACFSRAPLTVGQPVNGSLQSSDCQMADSTLADAYSLSVSGSGDLEVELTSSDFDTYLILTNSSGAIVAFDDDGATGTNSLIARRLLPGTYTVWVNSYRVRTTGAYQVLARDGSACSTFGTLNVGQVVSGSFGVGDCYLLSPYSDRWRFTLSAPSTVRLDLSGQMYFRDFSVSNGADVFVSDPGGLGPRRIEHAFPAGTYTVTLGSSQTGPYQLATSVPTSGSVNLGIAAAYLTQSVQSMTGAVPLVRGRPGLLRVFVRASETNSAAPTVRARFYHGATLVDTRTIAAPSASVPTEIGEGTLSSSWNVAVPADLIQPNLAILIDVDPDNTVAESNESDNIFPAGGTALPLEVRDVAPLGLTLVPVRMGGFTGAVSDANRDAFVEMLKDLHPLATVDVTVRSVYTTSLPAVQSLDQNKSWTRLLGELDALRIAEGGGRSYYGVLSTGYSSGVAGLAYIGAPTAVGWDRQPSAREVLAHEMGHTFGRFHAPCGNPGGPDPNYPYADGSIGASGYNTRTSALRAATAPDIMSYCSNPWIGDYTYRGVLEFRAKPTGSSAMQDSALLVWGHVDNAGLELEPVIMLDRPALATAVPGPYSVEGFDNSGRRLFVVPFAPTEILDAPRKSARFAFTIPASALAGGTLARLRLTGPDGRRVERTRSATASPRSTTVLTMTSGGRGAVTVEWDAEAHPLAVIRSPITGEILSFARGGRVSLSTTLTELHVQLSDGTGSAAHRLRLR